MLRKRKKIAAAADWEGEARADAEGESGRRLQRNTQPSARFQRVSDSSIVMDVSFLCEYSPSRSDRDADDGRSERSAGVLVASLRRCAAPSDRDVPVTDGCAAQRPAHIASTDTHACFCLSVRSSVWIVVVQPSSHRIAVGAQAEGDRRRDRQTNLAAMGQRTHDIDHDDHHATPGTSTHWMTERANTHPCNHGEGSCAVQRTSSGTATSPQPNALRRSDFGEDKRADRARCDMATSQLHDDATRHLCC